MGLRRRRICISAKKVADLTLAECATLAGLVRGPSIYNPVYSPEAAAKVRNATLERMFE